MPRASTDSLKRKATAKWRFPCSVDQRTSSRMRGGEKKGRQRCQPGQVKLTLEEP